LRPAPGRSCGDELSRQLGPIVCLASLAVLVGCGSGGDSNSQTGFSYRAHGGGPTQPFRNVLEVDGLNLQANCRTFNGAPVFDAAASTTVRGASFGIHYGLQDGETPTFVDRNLYALTAENGASRVLGPIGRHDAAAGTMTFLRPDGGSVTVTFVAMTGAANADCAFGGSALVQSGDG
jgi:hypothetical protein